ncbi:MAG: tRNA lysidine(34) synthetase TilS [Bacteroidia bacterium]|nr:tRNA lysidine(34) synthetase TilS [Bacteroidia bacterium]
MTLDEKVNHFLKQYCKPKAKLIVAVSGGRDSMCLLHAVAGLGYNLIVAHCNFKLRGDESDDDEKMVKKYCTKNGLQFYSIAFDTLAYSQINRTSIQISARELRYEWFEKLRLEHKADYILTAHHVNDNVETFLFNISRGAGLHGLSGIPFATSNILRPLINCTTHEIEEYQNTYKIEFRNDSSNESDKYSRNYIRKHIIPKLNTINPNAVQHIQESIQTISILKDITKTHFAKIAKQYAVTEEKTTTINLQALSTEKHYELFLVDYLRTFGFNKTQTNEILHAQNNGVTWYAKAFTITVNKGNIVINKINSDTTKIHYTLDKITNGFEFNGLQFTIEPANAIEFNDSKLYLDIDNIKFPITIRTKQIGDKWKPLGLKGKSKKLSDFFIDKKVNQFEKNNSLVIADKEKICAVVPFTISELVKITDKTKQVIVISNYKNR